MMEVVRKILASPPAWILVIIGAILGVHLLGKLFAFIRGGDVRRYVIGATELIMVLVLAGLTVELYFERMLGKSSDPKPYGEPFVMLIMLLFFGIVSMCLYRRLNGHSGE